MNELKSKCCGAKVEYYFYSDAKGELDDSYQGGYARWKCTKCQRACSLEEKPQDTALYASLRR